MAFKKYILLCLFFFGLGVAFAQSGKSFEEAADEAFAKKDYATALTYYQNAIAKGRNDNDIYYKTGESARLFNSYKIANEYLEKVSASSEKGKYPNINYHLGLIKKNLAQYEEAKVLMEKYIETASASRSVYDPELVYRANQELKILDQIVKSAQNPQKDTIIQLDRGINSNYSDFAPAIIDSVLYFSSLRYVNDNNNMATAKILTYNALQNESKPIAGFNDESKITAHTSFSEKTERMYFTKCDYINGTSEIRCDLYFRTKGDGKWSREEKVPEPINMSLYTNTQPCVVYDPIVKSEILYFVSDRPGGKGKLDIWYSLINTEGVFSQPTNLAFANSSGNDITPFYHTGTQTLFFSSDARESIGGYDIYKMKKKGGLSLFEKPQNLGVPINSSFNDLYYFLDKWGKTAYFSSNRPGSLFVDKENETCCYDIYKIASAINSPIPTSPSSPNDPAKKTEEVKIFVNTTPETPKFNPKEPEINTKPKQYDNKTNQTTENNKNSTSAPTKPNSSEKPTYNPNPPKTQPTTEGNVATKPTTHTPSESEKSNNANAANAYTMENLLPMALFFDNDEPDSGSKNSVSKYSYDQTFFAYYNKKDIYKNSYSVGLKDQEQQIARQEIENFFEQELRKAYGKLVLFSAMLEKRLDDGEKVEIFIKGYSSAAASADYNYLLSQRRINSVLNYFKSYRKGALNKYFDSGQLKFTQIPFGETQSANPANEKNTRMTIYSPAAAYERRVELIETKTERFRN